MDDKDIPSGPPSPWLPCIDRRDLAALGKLGEELSECLSATQRCIIQGPDESEPETGKPNLQWLTEEIADVLTTIDIVIDWFELSGEKIANRVALKSAYLLKWHRMLQNLNN